MRETDREDRAVERYSIIKPLLDPALDKSAQVQLRKAIAKQCGVDERTVRRWVNGFQSKGFEGLKPKTRTERGNPVITKEILDKAISYRRECPTRSVETIIKILEMEKIVEEGTVKRSTLQEALQKAGFSSAQMRVYAPDPEMHYARRFQKEFRNALWQMDVKYGPSIDGQKTYLFSVIDDATRYVCHSEFFMSQDLDSLRISLRHAFEHAGIPDVLYLDNGKIFRSKLVERMAAKLGIKLTFIKPYTPQSHGKIERFNRTVDGFLCEAALEKSLTLESMNGLYEAWLSDCYQNKAHSGIGGRTPKDAFEQDEREVRMASPEDLTYAFLTIESRKVNKTGCISLDNEQWEIEEGSLLIGRRVDVLRDPTKPDEARIECEGYPTLKAKKLVIKSHTGRFPNMKMPEKLPEETHSRLLQGLKTKYDEQKEQERQYALSYASMECEEEKD